MKVRPGSISVHRSSRGVSSGRGSTLSFGGNQLVTIPSPNRNIQVLGPGLYDRSMAYDEALADRIRELLESDRDVREQKMFGGLSFLVNGHMAVAASGKGGVLVRVDPVESDRLVDTTSATLMDMGGRTMRGWLRVDEDSVRTKRQLARWVGLGTTYARSLPAKKR